MKNHFKTMSILTRFIHLNHLQLSKRIKELDPSISKPQAGIIIHMNPGQKYKVGELADILDVTPGAITHASKIILKKGYIERETGDDLRTVFLKLTEKGERLREKIIEELEHLNKGLLEFLEPQEQKEFTKLLKKIVDKLEMEINSNESVK